VRGGEGDASEVGTMKQAEWEQLILCYLQEKGYDR